MIGLLFKLGAWVRANPALATLCALFMVVVMSQVVTAHRLKNARADLALAIAARDSEAANHRATKANYRKAQAEAALEHEAVKLAVESHWKDVAHDTQTDLRDQLDLARNSALRMLADRAARTGAGSASGQAEPAPTATATAAAGGAGALPQLDDDDVLICTENTVKARGWPAFYEGLGAAR